MIEFRGEVIETRETNHVPSNEKGMYRGKRVNKNRGNSKFQPPIH